MGSALVGSSAHGLGVLFLFPLIVAMVVFVLGAALTSDHRRYLRRRRRQF